MNFEISSRPRLTVPFNLTPIATEKKLIAESINHRCTQLQLYVTFRQKSIHKKQQNYFFNSTSITANDALLDYELNNRHMLSLALPLVSYNFRRLFNPSLNVSQAWKMISFWAETSFWVSIYHAHELHELPRIEKHICHKDTKAQRYTKRVIIKKTLVSWRLGGQTSAHELHELPRKKAQSIGLNHITPNEKSPKPAQGMIHTLSLAPQGVLIQGETFMIKHYRMIIDLTVNISERITPEIIEKAKENCSTETDFCPRQEYLDMSQDIITYIIGRPDLHIECIYAGLLFKLFSYNSDEDLNITEDVDTDLIENNMMIAAEALGPRYVTFINKVYQLPSEEDDDDNLPAAKSNIIVLADAKAKPKEMPREERDILIDIIQLCLMDCTINSSNLEPAAEETLPIDGEKEE